MIDVSHVTNITADSRKVQKNGVFVAIRGHVANGEDYISDAVKAQVKYIVVRDDLPYDKVIQGPEYIRTKNIRLYLSQLAAEFYKKQPDYIVGITGTNGKTSVAHFYKQICSLAGKKAATLGTMGLDVGYHSGHSFGLDESITSPDPITLHQTLKELEEDGCTHLALEASSHGLDQYRMDGVNFNAVAFTNFSQDHLDYHASMEEYFAAKLRLFEEVIHDQGWVVLNADIPEYEIIRKACEKRGIEDIVTYGKKGKSLKLLPSKRGISFEFFGEPYAYRNNVEGEFQKYNILCAIGLAISSGMIIDDIIPTLARLYAPPGRLQSVCSTPENGSVYIDFAHTPDALKIVLQTLREGMDKGRLILVFGCGGDRDQKKRPLMGEIANEYADLVVVTDDNPRNEDPLHIRKEIMETCKNAVEVEGRSEAIRFAMQQAKHGDKIIIAGKGHEEYQEIKGMKHHFSDAEEVRKCLSKQV